MKVILTISADLMDGQTMEDITAVDVLACSSSEIMSIATQKSYRQTKAYLQRNICKIMCKLMEMPQECLTTKDRSGANVNLRFSVAFIMHRTGRFSLKEIAEAMGRKDHTTAIHAIKAAKNRIQTLDMRFEPFRLAIIETEKAISNRVIKMPE